MIFYRGRKISKNKYGGCQQKSLRTPGITILGKNLSMKSVFRDNEWNKNYSVNVLRIFIRRQQGISHKNRRK